jgi:8-oxo-dGTP diphosphatase
MTYTYPYPRPAVTVDIILVKPEEDGSKLLLIQRGHPPFAGRWALPGGFVDEDEPLLAAAHRELYEETGLEAVSLHHLAAFGDPGRDPRGWTVSVVYWGRLEDNAPLPRAGDDASDARWWPLDSLPELAFDHEVIVAKAIEVLERKT